MSKHQYRQACDPCHESKVKCVQSPSQIGCRRCRRLDLTCRYSTLQPRRTRQSRGGSSAATGVSSSPDPHITDTLDALDTLLNIDIGWLVGQESEFVSSIDDPSCLPVACLPPDSSTRLAADSETDMQQSRPANDQDLPTGSEAISDNDPGAMLLEFREEVKASSKAKDSTSVMRLSCNIVDKVLNYFLQVEQTGLHGGQAFSSVLLYINMLFSIQENLSRDTPCGDFDAQLSDYCLASDDLTAIREIIKSRICAKMRMIAATLLRISRHNHQNDSALGDANPCVMQVFGQRLELMIESRSDVSQT